MKTVTAVMGLMAVAAILAGRTLAKPIRVLPQEKNNEKFGSPILLNPTNTTAVPCLPTQPTLTAVILPGPTDTSKPGNEEEGIEAKGDDELSAKGGANGKPFIVKPWEHVLPLEKDANGDVYIVGEEHKVTATKTTSGRFVVKPWEPFLPLAKDADGKVYIVGVVGKAGEEPKHD